MKTNNNSNSTNLDYQFAKEVIDNIKTQKFLTDNNITVRNDPENDYKNLRKDLRSLLASNSKAVLKEDKILSSFINLFGLDSNHNKAILKSKYKIA